MALTDKIVLAWVNWIDAATLTAGSETSSLPVGNLQNAHVVKKWQTAFGVNASYFIAAFGSSKSFQAVALLGTNLTIAATIRVRASDADPTGAAGEKFDSGTVPAGIRPGYGGVYYLLASAVSALYLRIDIADATIVDTLQIGRAVAAPIWQPTRNFKYGWSADYSDESKVARSRGGQDYPDPGARRRIGLFTLQCITEDEAYGNLFELARANGIVKDVLVIPKPLGARVPEQAIWGRVTQSLGIAQDKFPVYRASLRIEERL